MLIDAHQHFWRIGQHDCQWPGSDLAEIHRDFIPADLHSLGSPLGLTGSVLVQSQPSAADTAWLLELAEADTRICAVVGWTDLAAADAEAQVRQLSRRAKLKGLRPMLQSLDQDDWILSAGVAPALHAMIDAGLSLDALIFPRHLPVILTLADRFPDLPIVIDHGGKPPIANGAFQPWADEIAKFADKSQVFCKLSGLLTEAGDNLHDDDIRPYVRHLIDVFGPQRLMWGSDWPVINLKSDYASWLNQSKRLCDLTDLRDLAAVFGETAQRFYRFPAMAEA